MARPKVQDKEQAILDAAIEVFAKRGFWDTPTSLISKTAGIADGTLFTYFKTKDDLINEVYLEIKRSLAAQLVEGMVAQTSFKEMMRYFWHQYIEWALDNPEKFEVLQQIGTSYELSEEVRAAGKEPFLDLQTLTAQSIGRGELCNYPVEFLSAVLEGLAMTTIRFIRSHPEMREECKHAGFEILWNGTKA